MNVTSKPIDRDPHLSQRPWSIVIINMLVFGLIGPVVAQAAWRLCWYAIGDVAAYDGLYTVEDDVITAAILCPAFLTIGAMVAFYGAKIGPPPLWLPVLPVIAFFGAILLYDVVVPPPPDVTPWLLLFPTLSGVLATFLCGLIARRLWQART